MYLPFNCQAYDFRDSFIVNVKDALYKLDRHIRKYSSILNLASYSILYYLWSANLSQSLSRSIFFKIYLFSFNIMYLCSFDIFFNSFCQYLSFLNIFSTEFARWKSVRLPHITFIVIH